MLRSLRLPRLLPPLLAALALTAMLWPGALWAQADGSAAVSVRVLPRSEVQGQEFTLGEVAELDGADVALVRRVAAVTLGRSPLPGRTVRVSEPLVRSRVAQVMDADAVRLIVPDGAEVIRASQVVAGADIGARVLEVAAEQAGAVGAEVEQELTAPIDDAVLPVGKVDWKIEPMGRHLSAGGARSFRVVASVNGAEAWRRMARVDQQVYREVVLAARAIRRNQIIAPGDLVVERKPIVGVKDEAYLTRVAEATGARAKRPIGRGEWLHKGLIAAVADVPEGGPVRLIYETEQVRFSTPGVAMVPGKVGEFIPVRNLQSGRIVYGVVQADDSVKVN